MTDLRQPAETAVHQCLALEPGERFVVVTDDERRDVGVLAALKQRGGVVGRIQRVVCRADARGGRVDHDIARYDEFVDGVRKIDVRCTVD